VETDLADGVLLEARLILEAVLVEAAAGFGAGVLAATTLPDFGFLGRQAWVPRVCWPISRLRAFLGGGGA